MKKHALLIPVACAALLSASCGNSDSGKDKAATQDSVVALKPVASSTVTPSPDFPGAALSIASVKAEKVGADSAKVSLLPTSTVPTLKTGLQLLNLKCLWPEN